MPLLTDYQEIPGGEGNAQPAGGAGSSSAAPGLMTGYTEIDDKPEREQSWLAKHTPDSVIKFAQGIQGVEQAVKGLGNLSTLGGTGSADRAMHDAIAKKYGEQAAESLAPIKSLSKANAELGQDLSAGRQKAEKERDEAQGFWNTAGVYARNPGMAMGDAIEQVPGLAVGMALGGPAGFAVQSAGTAAQNVLDKDPDNVGGAYVAAPIAAATTYATTKLGGKYLTPAAEKLAGKLPFVGDFVQKALAGAVDQGVQGAGMAAGSQLGENVGNGDPWSQNVGAAAGHGFVGGSIAGAAMHPVFHPKSALDGANQGVKTGDPAGDAANSVGSSTPHPVYDTPPQLENNPSPQTTSGVPVGAVPNGVREVDSTQGLQNPRVFPNGQAEADVGAANRMPGEQTNMAIAAGQFRPEEQPIRSHIDDITGVTRAAIGGNGDGQARMEAALNEPTQFKIHDPQTGAEIRPATLGDVIEASHNTDTANQQKQAEIKQQGGVALAESKFGPRADIIHAPSGQPVPGAHAWAGDEHTTNDEFQRAQAKLGTKELAKTDVQHDLEHVFVDAWREHNPMDRPADAEGLGPHPTPKELDQFTKLIGIGDVKTHADAVMKIDQALKKLERSKAESSDFKRGVLNEWRKKLIGENNGQVADRQNPQGANAESGSSAEVQRPAAESSHAESNPVAEGSGSREAAQSSGTEAAGKPELQERQPADVQPGPAEAAEGLTARGGDKTATYKVVKRNDGSSMLTREIRYDDGEVFQEYMDQDHMWQKGTPSAIAVHGAQQVGGAEAFPTAEHALRAARDDAQEIGVKEAEPAKALDPVSQQTVIKVKKRRTIDESQRLQGQEQATAGNVDRRPADVGPVADGSAGELRQPVRVEAGAARDSSVRSEGAADRSAAGDATVSRGVDGTRRQEVRAQLDAKLNGFMRGHVRESFQVMKAQLDKGMITPEEAQRRLDEVKNAKSADDHDFALDVLEGEVPTIAAARERFYDAQRQGKERRALAAAGEKPALEAPKQEAGEEVAHPRFKELADQLFPGKNAARDLSIFAAVHDGSSLADVAAEHGLTEGRISQLSNEAWRQAKAAEIPQAMKNIGMEPEELMKLFHDEAAKRRAKSEADEALERAAVGDKAYEIQQELGYGHSSLNEGAGEHLTVADREHMGEVTPGGSQGEVVGRKDPVTQWAQLREKQEDLIAKGKHAEADALQEKMDALEEQIRKRGFESEFNDEHAEARTAWEKQELHQESGVRFDDLPSSLKSEWHDAVRAGTSNRDRFASIVDKYDNGMYEYDSRTSPGFKEMAEADATTTREVEAEYDRLGIGHALDAPNEYRIVETHEFDGDGYAAADRVGMSVGIRRDVVEHGGALLSHTLRHEVGHVIDDIGHGGVYSIQPEMRFSLGEGGWKGAGEVAREVQRMYESGDEFLESLFDYPMNRDAYPMSRKRLQAEVFSQLWSMYTNPKWRARLEEHAPATAQFMKEVVEHVKRNPETVQHGTELGAEVRSNHFAFRDAEGRAEGDTRPGQDRLEQDGPGDDGPIASRNGRDAVDADERLRQRAAEANARRAARRSSTDAAEQAAAASGKDSGTGGFADAPGRAERVISKLPEGAQKPVQRIYDNLAHAAATGSKALAFGHDLAKWAEKTLGMKAPREYMDAMSRKDAYRNALNAHLSDIGSMVSKLKRNEQRVAGEFLTETTMQKKWGYEADWNKGVTVDPATKARFDKLPTHIQDVIKAVNKEGVEQQQREFAALQEISRRTGVEMPADATPKMDGPYAPLRRHGDYVVEAKSHELLAAENENAGARVASLKQDPNHYYYGHERSMADARTMKRELDTRFGSNNVRAMARDQYYRDNHGASFAAVDAWARKIEDALSTGPQGDAKYAKQVADDLKELYLSKVADNSARAAGLKRGNVVGVKGEQALMSFFMNGQNRNRMVSEALHGDAINVAQAKMSREVKEATSPQQAKERQDFVNEFAKRRIQQMKNEPSRVMDNLLQFNSAWRLLSSPAHYLQYISQPVTMALPILQGRFGYGSGWRELHAGLQDAIAIARQSSWTKPNISKHVNKVGDEVAMLKSLQARNILEHGVDLEAGRPAIYSDNAGSAAFHKAMGKLSMIPRTLETHNRILSSLAAYRLAFKDATAKGKSAVEAHEAGTKFATDTIMSAFGDYSAANAPRALASANPVLRLATQYKKFHVLHGSMVVGLGHEAFKGATPQERMVAKKSLAFMAGHYGVLAGAAGIPGAMLVASAFKHMFGDDHDKAMDTESYLREAMGPDNKDMADLLIHGVPGVMGFNLERKIGAGDIFDPLVKPLELANNAAHGEMPDRRQIGDAALAVLGPTGGTAINMLGGVGQMMQGNWYEGLAAMMPKGIQDGLKAYGLATDGFVDKQGVQRVAPENLTTADVVGQAMGVTPKTVADANRITKDEKADETGYQKKFAEMSTEFQRAMKAGDANTMADVQQRFAQTATEMSQAGMKPPSGSILFRDMVTGAKKQALTQHGVQSSLRNHEAVRQRLLAQGMEED